MGLRCSSVAYLKIGSVSDPNLQGPEIHFPDPSRHLNSVQKLPLETTGDDDADDDGEGGDDDDADYDDDDANPGRIKLT